MSSPHSSHYSPCTSFFIITFLILYTNHHLVYQFDNQLSNKTSLLYSQHLISIHTKNDLSSYHSPSRISTQFPCQNIQTPL
jgi:hypothetical protein